jgi:hypothetical protein
MPENAIMSKLSWVTKNLHELHKHPLYKVKAAVWYFVSSTANTGPHFFEKQDGKIITIMLHCNTLVEHFSCQE